MAQDVRYALRALGKARGFTVVVVVTLAIGIAANTTIFSLVDALLFRPLPHLKDTSRLVALYTGEFGFVGVSSYMDYVDFRDRSDAFEELAAFKPLQMDLAGDGSTERVDGMIVTANYFKALGVTPALGRFFFPEEDRTPGAEAVAVLGYGLWQRRFAFDRSVIGRSLVLHGRSFTVVGVAPRDFRGTSLDTSPELFAPMMMQPHFMPGPGNLLDNRGWGGTLVVGRLAEGVTLAEARDRIAGVAVWLKQSYPTFTEDRQYSLVPLKEASLFPEARGQIVSVAALLMIVVGGVLLVATVNVVNLILARSTTRRRELALRQALGAGRARLVRQLLVESILLSLMGGGVALILAAWTTEWILVIPIPLQFDPALDLRVLAFTLAVSVATGVLVGTAPALKSTRVVGLLPELDDRVVQSGRPTRFRWSDGLVAGQIGLSLLLLILAGLFTQTLVRLGRVAPGFDAHDVLTATLDPAAQGYDGARISDFYRRVSERVDAIAGVTVASVVSGVPGLDNDDVVAIQVEGHASDRDGPTVSFNVVGPSYFETMRIPVAAGRVFSDADFQGSGGTVMVNETGARFLQSLTGREPLGTRLSTAGPDGPFMEVIGIARDSKTSNLREDSTPLVYFPHRLTTDGGMMSRMTLLVRTEVDPWSLVPQLREALLAVDANVPPFDIRTLEDRLSETLFREKLSAGLLSSFAVLALVLAAVGLYGVVTYLVSQRAQEFGIRIALGAEPVQIVSLVSKFGIALAVTGVGLGVLASLAVSRLISSFLYGITSTDPLTYLGLSTLLATVCLLACYLPARRAMKADPVEALRRA